MTPVAPARQVASGLSPGTDGKHPSAGLAAERNRASVGDRGVFVDGPGANPVGARIVLTAVVGKKEPPGLMGQPGVLRFRPLGSTWTQWTLTSMVRGLLSSRLGSWTVNTPCRFSAWIFSTSTFGGRLKERKNEP